MAALASEYLANLQAQQSRQIAALTGGDLGAAALPGTPPGTPPPLRGATLLPATAAAAAGGGGLPPAQQQPAAGVLPPAAGAAATALASTLVPDPSIVAGLEAMGFPLELCRRAAVACNNSSVESCMEWALAAGS